MDRRQANFSLELGIGFYSHSIVLGGLLVMS